MVAVTGVGSLPGSDMAAASRMVLAAMPAIAAFPELPARGPQAAMIGRSLALLDGLDAELVAGEWRLSATPGIDLRRARATWRDDLEQFEEAAQGYEGRVKVGVAGPWTLAVSVFRPLGGRVLGDRGARRDVAQALAQGVEGLRADWLRRFGSDLLLQVDEPSLPAVLAARVPTEGGFFRHRWVDAAEASELVGLLRGDVLHSCAPALDVALALRAGFAAVALDQDLIDVAGWDALGAAVADGTTLYLGCVPTASGVPAPSADALTRRVLAPLRPLELGPDLIERLVLTPACGLAGWTPRDASAVFATLAVVADRIADELSR